MQQESVKGSGSSIDDALTPLMSASSSAADLFEDPYPLYRRLLDESPVHKSELGPWIVSRHADVSRLARSELLGRERNILDYKFTGASADSPTMRLTLPAMIFRDPPAHTRLRSLVTKAFTPRRVEALRPRVEALVEESLDALVGSGEMDLLLDFSYPLPLTVISHLLGIPPDFHEAVEAYTESLVRILEPGPKPADVWEVADQRSTLVLEQIGEYVRQRRQNLGDDLLSALIEARDGAENLTEDEIVGQVVNLHIAGFETTANLIANGILTLLRTPEQLPRLQKDPSLAASTVEEWLRYETPARTVLPQMAKQDIVLDGGVIPEGEPVILLLAAANRDPDVFEQPDRFDIDRSPNPHVTFSAGIHFCVGAHLGRLEAQIALEGLMRRLPNLQLATDNPQWRRTWTLRALEGLPVTWTER